MGCIQCSKLTFSNDNLGRKFCKFCGSRILEENTIYASGEYKKISSNIAVSKVCKACGETTFYIKNNRSARCNACGMLIHKSSSYSERNDKTLGRSDKPLVSKTNYQCRSCKKYQASNAERLCIDCQQAGQKLDASNMADNGGHPQSGRKLDTDTVKLDKPRFSFDFFSVMLILCFLGVCASGYKQSGVDGAITYAVIFGAGVCFLYFIGKSFGKHDVHNEITDIVSDGLLRVFVFIILISIPIGLLNIMGVVDLGSNGCSENSYDCEPDPNIPSFRWMD